MNATSLQSPPFPLMPLAKSSPESIRAADVGPGVRNSNLAQTAAETAESLRLMSLKALKDAGAVGGSIGAASLEAIKAIWEAMLALFRWLARVFGNKPRVAEGASDTSGKSAKEMLDSPESQVNLAANEMKDTIAAAEALPPEQADAFFKALEYAGLSGADASFLKFVQSPDALKNAKAPAEMLVAALTKADVALQALQPMLFQANADRAEAATKLSHHFSPPLNVEDLVDVFRSNRNQLSEADLPAVDALIAADDKLKAIVGHQALIRESMLAVTAAAHEAKADVTEHSDLLSRVLGDDWAPLVSTIHAEMLAKDTVVAPAVANFPPAPTAPLTAGAVDTVYKNLMSRIESGAKESSTPDAAQAAASFMAAGDAPPASSAPMSARERLRLASERAMQFPPPPSDDFQGDNDTSSNQRPEA